MPDRENVLKTLETCVRDDNSCDGCPLYGADGWCESEEMVEIPKNYVKLAIALLKAQEPRVMTLEEVIERRDSDAVYVEHMDGKMIVQPAILLPSFLDTDKECIHFASSWRTGGSYGRRCYGSKWRCWTSRPTDAQREEVKWE